MSRTCWKTPWGGVCLLTALIFVAKAAETKRLGLILQTHLPVQTTMPQAHPWDGGREQGNGAISVLWQALAFLKPGAGTAGGPSGLLPLREIQA